MNTTNKAAPTEQNLAHSPREQLSAREHLWPTYAPPMDLVFSHGRGTELYSEDGRVFLDFISGIAVTGFGHAHPQLVAALTEQAGKLWHLSNMFRIPGAERLATVLAENSFADAVFFTNSGTESVEAGLKAIRGYQAHIGRPERYRIIGFEGSFHGRSMAAVAAAGNPAHCHPFIVGDYGFDRAPWDDLAALKQLIGPQTAGIIIEPIQGEGGIRPASEEFLRGLRQLCDDHNLLLMFDEVQCGIGRSGALFAHQLLAVEPDILASAKGLGGGFPVGACLATKAVAEAMKFGSHGTTYGGNPLAMAVANKVMELVLEEGLLASVAAKGEKCRRLLQSLCDRYPRVLKGVAGTGLMIGVECGPPNSELLLSLRERGLLVGKAGANMLRLLPPLNVSEAHIAQAVAILEEVVAEADQAETWAEAAITETTSLANGHAKL
ncbi:aspartate aminotransferase family protein [Halioxenophilus sp. WMMB6]|uniref:aspartate aminotransferase family protein n=1 Tax=Halioxenophilus sp. WMMB6 TaxID=3073815 RepID=UPI00295ECD35|nr:aspartate aminotransferase family protein [Halioxenophilus sp. WMMB6]